MTQTRSIPIRESDSPQGVSLRVIENPQPAAPKRSEGEYKKLGISLSPLQKAHSRMVAELSLLAPSIPQPSADPTAEEIREFEPHLVKVAEAVDRYFLAMGKTLHSHVLGVDVSQFEGRCLAALDGNALHEIETAGYAIEDATYIRTTMWVGE